MDRRRDEYIARHRHTAAGYDIRPVVHTRRVAKLEVAPVKPSISAYRVSGRPIAIEQPMVVRQVAAVAVSPEQPVKREVRSHTQVSGANPEERRYVPKKRNTHHRKRRVRKPQLALTGLAVLVFLIGIGVSIDGFRKNQIVEAQVSQASNAAEASEEVLDDTEPTSQAVKNHTVPPDTPRYIVIDKIKVKARVKALDTKANGELAVPKNIFDVGWYQSGNKPGKDGAMLMDGHVSSPRKAGVFKNLPKLQAGDIIKVERGDGVVFRYKVVKTKAFPADSVDMQSTVVPVTPGKQGLNLITCHGKVKPGTHDFSERFVVYAEEI